ncbi:MAG: hypothetical protein IJU25_05360 [Lachnospiraceae bacterium]|nr:hypothetical protein [Lachnospiraceae bacterium]
MKTGFATWMKQNRLSGLYYVLVVLGYTATLFFTGMRPGVFATLLMALVVLELVFHKELLIGSLPDIMVVCFFVYQILSLIWLRAGGYPFSVFAEEFISSVLPMVFYFVGKTAGDRTFRWYRWYLIAMLILGILGVILYAWAPQFYNDWSFAWNHTSKADAATTRVRMNSVVGSTCLSFTMVAGMLSGAYFLSAHEDNGAKKQEDASKSNGRRSSLIFGIVCMALCFLFAILANQRSGLVAAALVIVYVNYLLFFDLHLIKRKYFWIELCVIAGLFLAACAIRFDYVLKFWYRIISLPSAISERSEQWVAAVNNMYSVWLGNGLGANGHRAIGIEGAHVIADGGLIKLYCENGVLGFSMWLFLVILACKRGLKRIAVYYTELGIVAIGILQSIGSNMLAFQLCAPVFWFAIGKLCEKDPD